MSGEDQGNDPIPHNDAIESLLEQSGDAMDVVQGETSAPGGESGARRVRKPSAAYRDMESSEKLVIRNVFVTKKMQIEKERKIKMKEREKEKERKDQEQRELEAKEKEQKEKEKEKDRLKKLKEVTGTLPTLPKKEVNAKEKALDEMEEGLISAVLRRKTTASNRKKPLPEGPADLKDLDAALNQSFVDNTSVLCDWNIPEAKMIGHLCKVYWDGEDTWFYARILNYDRNHKKHYIYYLEDCTAEWIKMDEEYVLTGTDLVFARLSATGAPWPALSFTATPKAEEQLRSYSKFFEGAVYVEFFNDSFVNEAGYIAPEHMDPIQDAFKPKKPSRKFEKSLEAAKEEQSRIDGIVHEVVKACRSSAYRILKGEDWIGVRVRAETHRALSKNERIRYQVGNATINKAFCFGTITNFCPSTNECFVVFDVPTLQPQWVTCIKGQIEILVGASEYANGHGKATSNIVSSSSSSSSSTLVVKSEPLAEEQHLEGEKLNNQAMGEEIQPYEDFDVNAKACHLCHLHCKYTDSVFTCTVCNLSCHTHCIPPSGLKPLNEPTQKSKVQAKCWNCTTCYGCGVNSWNASLINWNVRRVETTAAEKFILLCGACLHRYKHFQEFCTICYKLYSDSPRLVALAEEDDQRQSQSSHEDVHVKCEHVTEESESMHGKIKPLDDQSMIQCNECERWVHALCEGIDTAQYIAITEGTHPVWGDEYLCPICRVKLSQMAIQSMKTFDKFYMFAEPVTKSVAANYYDIIRNPMDLFTMSGKSDRGLYKSLQAIRQDVELMAFNALVFNRTGDDYWTHAKNFYLLIKDWFERNKHKSSLTAYGVEAECILIQNAPDAALKLQSNLATSNGKPVAASSSANPDVEVEGIESGGKKSSKKRKQGSNTADEKKGNKKSKPAEPTEGNETKEEEEEDEFGVISITLKPSAEPASYVQPFIYMQSAEEALYSFCEDQCFVCGSVGNPEQFLFCIDCGEAYHNFCSGTNSTALLQSSELRQQWRCINCKLCESCHLVTEKDSETLVFCESCDKSYHIYCVQPQLANLQDATTWYCQHCVKCQQCHQSNSSVSAKRSVSNMKDAITWSFSNTSCYACYQTSNKQKSNEAIHEPKVITEGAEKKLPSISKKKQKAEAINKKESTTMVDLTKEMIAKDLTAMHTTSQSVVNTSFATLGSCLTCIRCGVEQNNTLKASNHGNMNWKSAEFWTCSACLLPSSNQKASSKQSYITAHLSSHPEATTVLQKVANIQKIRYIRCKKLQDLVVHKVESNMEQFRLANGFYYFLIILWANARLAQIIRKPISLKHPTFAASPAASSSSANANQQTAPGNPAISPSFQWINARSRRYINLMRRKIHRAKPNVILAGGGIDIARLLLASQDQLEFVSRLSQLASTFLYGTEYDGYPNVLQKYELMLAVIQVAFIISHENTLSETLPENTYRAVEDILKLVCLKLDIPSQQVLQLNLQQARQVLYPPAGSAAAIASASSSSPSAQRQKLKPIISHTFQIQEINDIIGFILEMLSSLQFFGGNQLKLIEDFIAIKYHKTNMFPAVDLRHRKSSDAVLEYFKHCKNPLVSSCILSSSEAIADTYVDGIKTTTLTASDHASSSLTMRDWKPGYLMKQPLLQMKTHHNDMISLPQSVNTKSSHITPTVVSNTSDSIEVEEEFNIGAIVGFPQALKEFITEMEKDKTDMFTEIKREVESAATNEEALKALEEVNDRLMKKVDAMFAITADITVGEGEKAKQDMAKASMEGEAQFSAVNEMATTEIDKEDLYFSNSELIDSNTTMDVDQSIVLSTTESLLASKAQNLINHEAMKGWSPSNDQAEMAWMNPRTCIFCGDYQENELLGRLLPFSEGSVSHVNCIRWCYEVEEKEHVLYNVYEARERCSRQTCYYCHKRGATLNCKKWCRRSFHLRCAIACGSLLMDGSKTKELPDSACLSMFCPCHTELGLRKFGTNITLWTPSNPLSCLIFERDLDKKEMDEVCTILSQRRTDKAVKSGAVTILNIGNPILIDSWGFFNSDFIYPHHFRATRIYWSATKANTRTAYIFEILAITDTEHWDMTQMEYLQDMLEETNYDQDPQQQMNVYNSEYITGPIFRVAALDNLQRPIFARKIEHLYRYVMQRVEQCHALASSRLVHRHVYGMTPHQFFGLGLQFTRQAIEYIPESIASMISMNAEHRYSPSYKLPSEAEISHIQQAITSLKSATNTCVSVNGSSRADPFVQKVKMSGGTRLTRILTKVADHGEGDDAVVAATSNTANNGEEEEDCGMDLEKEGNLAEIEARVQKFKDMSKAYIKNPQSRLEVRKSPIHGWGLFAKINFEKDDVIVEYIGEKIRQVIADIREGIYENNGVGSCYLFRLDKDEIIDATKTGAMARFMNHCCEPNAYARIISCNTDHEEEKHIVIMAARDIQEGEEITYDYKFPIEDKKLKCYCGAPRCNGSMN